MLEEIAAIFSLNSEKEENKFNEQLLSVLQLDYISEEWIIFIEKTLKFLLIENSWF